MKEKYIISMHIIITFISAAAIVFLVSAVIGNIQEKTLKYSQNTETSINESKFYQVSNISESKDSSSVSAIAVGVGYFMEKVADYFFMLGKLDIAMLLLIWISGIFFHRSSKKIINSIYARI